MTLNNLGALYYTDTGRLAEAEKAFSETLTICRDLATDDPGAYRPKIAATLNKLGALYWKTGRLAEADRAYSEALTIYRELASSNPANYAGMIESLTKLLAKLDAASSTTKP